MDITNFTLTSTWAIAATGFSNPMYLQTPLGRTGNTDSTGFGIQGAACVVIAFEGTYTGVTVVHQQTIDPNGEDGWFDVEGQPSNGGSATSAGSTAGISYIFAAQGVRHRIKVTALATGTLEARAMMTLEALGVGTGGGGGGGGGDVNLDEVGGNPVSVGAGVVDTGTQRVTLADDDPAVAALEDIANSTATINTASDTNTLFAGATALTPKFVKIAASSSGNNTILAAVTSKKIRVLAYNFMGNGAVNAKFQDGAGGTDLTGPKYIASAGQGICAPYNPVGWFETTAATLLNLNLSGAVAVGGELVYVEV